MRKLNIVLFFILLCGVQLHAQNKTLIKENFETLPTSGLKLPIGWKAITKEGTESFKGKKDGYSELNAHDGNGGLKKGGFVWTTSKRWADTPQRDNWLIAPQLTYTDGASISLYARSKSPKSMDASADGYKPEEDPSARFTIMVSKGGNEAADFTIQALEAIQVPDAYTKYTVNLADPKFGLTSGDKIYVGIHVVDEVELTYNDNIKIDRILYIDDVVMGVLPTTPVTEISATEWTTNEVWTGERGISNTFTLKNTGVGTLTVSAITNLTGTPFSTTFNKEEVSLTEGKEYKFSFSYSPTAVGTHEQNFVITTNAGNITISLNGHCVAPAAAVDEINENFDSGIPNTWLVVNGDNDKNYVWKAQKRPDTDANGNIEGKALYLETANGTKDDWIVLPKVKVQNGYKMTLIYRSSNEEKGKISIKASKGSRKLSDFNINIIENQPIPQFSDEHPFHNFSINLIGGSINAGDEIYLAIQDVSDEGASLWGGKLATKIFIDNLRVHNPGSDAANIISFNIENQISSTLKNDSIRVIMPKATASLTSLAPTITISDNATIIPASGEAQDFSNGAVTYTVTAQDGVTTHKYYASAERAKSNEAKITGFYFEGLQTDTIFNVAKIDNITSTVEISIPSSVDITKLTPKITISTDASISPTNITDFSNDVTYTVTAENGTQHKWTIRVNVIKSDAAEITAFGINGHSEVATIVGTTNPATVSITLATGTNLSELMPTIVTSERASINPASGVVQNFNNSPIDYTVTAENGTKKVWKVTVRNAPNTEAKILTFSINGQVGKSTIDHENGTILATMPEDSLLTSIKPIITVSQGANVSPASNVAQNFALDTITYTVTAEDGTTTKEYKVTVKNAPSSKAEIIAFSINGINAEIDATAAKISITAPATANIASLTPTITISPKASINPASNVATDFSNEVKYTVTAEDGTQRIWTVKVQKEIAALEGLFEGFEGGAIPESWKTVDGDGDGKSWLAIKYAPFEGQYIAKTKFSTNHRNDWLISPLVKVRDTDLLTFMYRSAAENYKQNFNVRISKTKADTACFTINLKAIVNAEAEYTEFKFKLTDNDSISAGDKIYIAIQDITNNGAELHIDNVSVAPPASKPKVALLGSNHWRSVVAQNANESSKHIFALTNTLADTLKVIGVTMPNGFSTSLDSSAVSLTKDKTYTFNVTFSPKTVGEVNDSMVIATNGGSVSIALYGYAHKSTMYHEGFESVDSLKKWSTIDNDGDNNIWFAYKNDENAPDLAHTGESCMVSESALLAGGLATPDNWLITPRLTVAQYDKLTFWVGAVSDISFAEKYSVYISTTGNNVDDFDTTFVANNVLTTNRWTKKTIDLAEYVGKNVYIAFVHKNVTDQSQILLDNIIMPARYVATNPDIKVLIKQVEYPTCPLSQASYNFEIKVENNGASQTVATAVNVSVDGTSYAQSINLNTPLATDQSVEVATATPFVPATSGTYSVRINAEVANDENPTDNQLKHSFAVNDSVMARDNGTYTNFVGLGTTYGGTVGQVFEVIAKDTLTSVSFFKFKGSTNLNVSASVFGFDTIPTNELATSSTFEIEADYQGWITISLQSPLVLEKGKYLIGLNEDEASSLNLGVDQNKYKPNTCYIKMLNQWITAERIETSMQMTLLLRANFGIGKTQTSIHTEQIMAQCYPNPASSSITISDAENSFVTILRTNGTACKQLFIKSDHEVIPIDDLQTGLYIVNIKKDTKQCNLKLVVTR